MSFSLEMVAGTGTNYLDGLPKGVEQAHTALPTAQPEPDGIWLRTLQEVSANNNVAVQGSLIILGNERSGKSSIVSRLTGGERRNTSSVLEYNYLQIQADTDASYAYQLGGGGANGLLGPTDTTNLPVWVLDGQEEVAPMMRFAFPPNLTKCVVMLCASLEQPGNVLPALRRWYRLLNEQIRQFYQPEEIVQGRQAQIRFWQEYMEPIESSLHQSTVTLTDSVAPASATTVGGEQLASALLLPPEKGVLDENCGAMVFVVITKSDLYTEFSTEQLDKVQYHVRQFCLKHGAALIYMSAKEDLNTQLLHKYIAHRIYALPFTTPAYIVEKDRIFVPTGWDSEQKLSIVKEALGFGNSDVPMLPQQNDPTPFTYKSLEREVEAEEEQVFLNRLAAIALDTPSGGGGGTGQQSPRRDANVAKGMAADTNNTMLANFFSSLLTKDMQRPSSAKSGGSPAPSMSVDAEMHFQKMLAGGGSKSGGIEMAQMGAPHQRASSMGLTSRSDGGGGGTRNGDGPMMAMVPPMDLDGDNNDDFEDAPEGDDESFASSMGSQNVTPRNGVRAGGGGSGNSSMEEKGGPPVVVTDASEADEK